MKRILVVSVFFVIVIGTFLGCASSAKRANQRKDAIMFGMLYDHDNNPVKGVSVIVDGDRIGESDVMGRFMILDAKSGEHGLLLEKEGYEPVVASFVFDPLSMLYYKMITASQLLSGAERALAGYDYGLAHEMIDRAVKLEPYRSDALYLKAIVYYYEKDYENAKKMLDILRGVGYTSIYTDKLDYEIEESMK